MATATLVLAANAPDIDVLSYAKGPFFALSFRRGITHGWPALLLLPFVVAGAVLAWDRWLRRRRDPHAEPARAGPILVLAVAGLLTHPTLDWMNTYGMRWGLPLNDAWSYGDVLFIVDPFLWLVLGGSVLLASRPSRGGRIGWGALGAATTAFVVMVLSDALVPWVVGVVVIVGALGWTRGQSGAAGRRLVRVACAAVVLYIGGLLAMDGWAARQIVSVARAQGLATTDVMVSPVGGNPFVSEIELVTDAGYVPGVHRWRGSPRVELFPERVVPLVSGPVAVPLDVLQEVTARARSSPDVARYLVWSRYPYFRIEPEGDSWNVLVSDARYDGRGGGGSLSGLTVVVEGP